MLQIIKDGILYELPDHIVILSSTVDYLKAYLELPLKLESCKTAYDGEVFSFPLNGIKKYGWIFPEEINEMTFISYEQFLKLKSFI